jgi:ATP-dependent Lon protease
MAEEAPSTEPARGGDPAPAPDSQQAAIDAAADQAGNEPAIPEELPVLGTGPNVMYPALVVPFVSSSEADTRAIDDAVSSSNRMLAMFAQVQAPDGSYTGAIQPVGTAVSIIRMARGQGGAVQALLQGIARVRAVQIVQDQPWLRVRVERIDDVVVPGTELEGLTRAVVDLFQRLAALTPSIPQELAGAVAGIPNPGNLADFIAANVNFKPEQRQAILAEANVTARLRALADFLGHELEVAEVGNQIQSQVKTDLDKRQRDFILREQMAAIQRELGEGGGQPELAPLREKLDEAHLPPEARREADRELERLATLPAASPEYQVARNYLEWLGDLPWDKATVDTIDIKRAEEILNADHYGLEKVKRRILDYLAVRKLRPDAHGPILCFVGPPGVGKTSLGQSIAHALNRHFVRMSLGGVRDEAEIRGFRRTYVGALPGRIIQQLRRAEVNNPLMMLDEIDKLGSDYRGDPSAALLEVLDPAQNSSFVDHFLDVPFDLSHILFITTANVLDTIPPPLLDRMEVIQISGYTEQEKLEIAMRYLLPRQINESGLTTESIEVSREIMTQVIDRYTREAGVRTLERQIGALCRSVARRVAEGSTERVVVTPELLHEFLGPPIFQDELIREQDEVGVVTGLAATAAGGDVLFVEAAALPGHGKLTLTGHLGEVMQESAQAALTYARSRAPELGVPEKFFDEHDLHIHVPAGAVPKDGPSAGVTMATAIVSAVTSRPVHKEVAMTGEITLHGRVMPVGAIKEKLLAAHRAGARTVIIPRQNERDLEELPRDARAALEIVLADNADEVLNRALLPERRERDTHLTPAA